MGSFYWRVRSTFLFICSTIWTTEAQNTRKLKTSSKTKRNKTDVQNLENILRIPLSILVSFTSIFFGTMRLFQKFLDCTKGFPFNCFSYFATNWSFKKPKGFRSPFYNFKKTLRFLSHRYSADFGRSRLASNSAVFCRDAVDASWGRGCESKLLEQ